MQKEFTDTGNMPFVLREDYTKECEHKIAYVCLKIGMYLFQEVEVDLQNLVQDSDPKQQSLQILTERQAAAEATCF